MKKVRRFLKWKDGFQWIFAVKKENYQVAIKPCLDEDIVEIDTFRELKAIDKAYDV